MKRCLRCHQTYTDETLKFCRDDGSLLQANSLAPESPNTLILPGARTNVAQPTQLLQSEIAHGKETTLPIEAPRKSHEGRIEAASESKRRRRGVVIVVSVLILTAAGLAFWLLKNRSLSDSTNPAPIESVAVLPFVNESGNAEMEYLSDGMTESLINSLSQLPKLNVKARSSVFRYKGKEIEPQQIANELNVQAVLNGRVVQRGQDLILYLSLVDARNGNQIWGEQYNRKQADLLQLQAEIARDVSGKLRTKLSGADERRLTKNFTANAEAYRFYLLGRFHLNKRSKAEIYRAIEYFSQAVRADPNYAIAYSGLADAYAILQGYDKSVSPLAAQVKAREYALKALSLDDTLSEAHVSYASVIQSADFDFAGAEREFKRAIELDPKNGGAYLFYALLLTGLGRFDEAETNLRRVLELEPTSQNVNRHYGNFLMVVRRYDESEKQLRKAVELDPNFQVGYFSLANTLQMQGRYAEAVEAYATAREVAGSAEEAGVMRASFKKGGWRGFVLDFSRYDWMSDNRPKYIDAARLASIGENQRALDALEEAFAERETFLMFLKVDPRFDSLRPHPRFQDLLRRVGFPL
jgi:TolB-like protein/Tfp pilus assembly protein PilF